MSLFVVTGGAGFIGSHLVESLLAAGHAVRVVDDLSTGDLAFLAAVRDDVDVVVGDLRDPSVRARGVAGVDTVFHLAATHGGRGFIETHPVGCIGNISLDHQVFLDAVDAGAGTLVLASSACVYPMRTALDAPPFHEGEAGFDHVGQAFADTEYGWAKLIGELQLQAFARERGVNAIACRLFSAYGERENATHAVIALILRALAKSDPYEVWGDGHQIRGFTHVSDSALGLALGSTLSGFDVVNVGSGTPVTVRALVEAIFDEVGWRPEKIDYQVDKPVGTLSVYADTTKLQQLFGWAPSVDLATGLARTIAHCRSQDEQLASADLGLGSTPWR